MFAMPSRHRGLPERDPETGDEGQQRQRTRGDRDTVATHELAGPIGPRVATRFDRPAVQVTPDVVRQTLDRRVTPARLLVHRLENDVVEITGEPPAERPGVRDRRRRQRTDATRHARGGRCATGRRDRTCRRGDRGTRTHRFGLEHGADHFGRGGAPGRIGMRPGQQLVEQHAERVDVGGRSHLLGTELLGAGVERREGQVHGAELMTALRQLVVDLGYPEVEQLGHALGGHHDVARLEIPMNDQLAMRVLDRRAQREEEPEPLRDREHAIRAVGVQRLALDVFHHQIRQTFGRAATVQKPRDVGMIERGEDLPLASEAPDRLLVSETDPDQLESAALAEVALHALGQPHGAHAALTDRVQQPPGSEHRAGAGSNVR
jgi:hypothetical protein